MKAYLFSKGETTTELAQWSLERLGFVVVLIYDTNTTFFDKYKLFLEMAVDSEDEIVVRADADVIVHKNFGKLVDDFVNEYNGEGFWWVCGRGFCFLKMETIDTAPQIIARPALLSALANLGKFKDATRPETELTRLADFYDPRRFEAQDIFTGLHGYKQSQSDIDRVIAMKKLRNQYDEWDHDLINKLKEF